MASTVSVSFLMSSSHMPSLFRLSMHSADVLMVCRLEALISGASWVNLVHSFCCLGLISTAEQPTFDIGAGTMLFHEVDE
jgi:hypothetical protein